MTVKIGFQGEVGAYGEYICKNLSDNAKVFSYHYFEDVFKALQKKELNLGVIPIENSLVGSIHENFDLLQKYHFKIISERLLKIQHTLMCRKNSSFKQIKKVYSHPQALSQCSDFFKENPQLKQKVFYDTAGAAKHLMEKKMQDGAAIASSYAAKQYDLQILNDKLANLTQNFTRFLVVTHQNQIENINEKINLIPSNLEDQDYKTSIAFSPKKEEQGILFKLLEIFSKRNINFLRIESRPIPKQTFEYIFYLDIQGQCKKSPTNPIQEALDLLQENCSQFQNYGSYPIGSKIKMD